MHSFLILILGFMLIHTNHSYTSQLVMSISMNKELAQKDDDPFNGPKKEYYINGNIMKEYTLKKGKIEGSYKFYSTIGKLVSDQFYKDGEPNGYLKTYYESGQLKSEGNMKPDGDISGPSKEYYEDGTLKSESNLSGQAPEFTGQSKRYRKNGQLESESTFSNGKLVYSVTYDDQGRVTSEEKPGKSISYWYERDTGKRHVSINGVPQD